MGLIVQKYGGTSVADAERIRRVAERLLATKRAGHDVVAVISAMAGVTDNLIQLAREISVRPTERELDALLATGEQGASALTAMAVNALGGKAVSLSGAAAGIVTDGVHTKAKISHISPRQINELLAEDYIVIVAGFQGQSPQGAITTLGRGGSDLTAIALAAALKADDCQIFTDVDGVHTCDPRVVPDASKIDEIAHDELLEMAGAGSKVMQARAVEFAKKFGVGFEVRSSLKDAPGTRARAATPNMEDVVVRGVSLERNQAKVTICGVPDRPGCAGKIFSVISAANVSVDMIVQNASSTGTTDVSFTLHKDDFARAEKLLTPLVPELGALGITATTGVAKLSVVGIGMRSHAGVASRLFACLGEAGVNIQLISTSEIKIAVVVGEGELDRAAQATHGAFGLAPPRPTASTSPA
ncbi:MAG TPA: aspartate kinase [Chthoniobacterales bacterium]|nr:aspartate kinase [Chthoniobacterales bacterium]